MTLKIFYSILKLNDKTANSCTHSSIPLSSSYLPKEAEIRHMYSCNFNLLSIIELSYPLDCVRPSIVNASNGELANTVFGLHNSLLTVTCESFLEMGAFWMPLFKAFI